MISGHVDVILWLVRALPATIYRYFMKNFENYSIFTNFTCKDGVRFGNTMVTIFDCAYHILGMDREYSQPSISLGLSK